MWLKLFFKTIFIFTTCIYLVPGSLCPQPVWHHLPSLLQDVNQLLRVSPVSPLPQSDAGPSLAWTIFQLKKWWCPPPLKKNLLSFHLISRNTGKKGVLKFPDTPVCVKFYSLLFSKWPLPSWRVKKFKCYLLVQSSPLCEHTPPCPWGSRSCRREWCHQCPVLCWPHQSRSRSSPRRTWGQSEPAPGPPGLDLREYTRQ